MNNKTKTPKQGLQPKLRFPEFRDAGDWEATKLSNAAMIVMGSSPKSECYNQSQIGLPLLQGNADVKNRLSSPRIFTSEIIKECTIGDILLSVRAPVGTVAKSIHHACIGRGISAIRSKHPNSQEFIYQWLLSFEPKWADISQGGTFDAVNSDDLRGVIVAVPSPIEQQKIANCLSSLDELIGAEGQKLNALQRHKKGLMQEIFPAEGKTLPKHRFPEFQDKPEWEMKRLDEVARFVNDRVPLEQLSITSYVSTENILPDFAGITTSSKLPSTGSATKFKANDILISNIRPYLKKVWFSDKEGGASNDVLIIRSKEKIIDRLLSFMLRNDAFIDYVMKGAKGVKMPRGDIALIREFPISYPLDKKEQQKIADFLTSIDDLITAQSQKLNTLKAHKKGLMQQLFPTLSSESEG